MAWGTTAVLRNSSTVSVSSLAATAAPVSEGPWLAKASTLPDRALTCLTSWPSARVTTPTQTSGLKEPEKTCPRSPCPRPRPSTAPARQRNSRSNSRYAPAAPSTAALTACHVGRKSVARKPAHSNSTKGLITALCIEHLRQTPRLRSPQRADDVSGLSPTSRCSANLRCEGQKIFSPVACMMMSSTRWVAAAAMLATSSAQNGAPNSRLPLAAAHTPMMGRATSEWVKPRCSLRNEVAFSALRATKSTSATTPAPAHTRPKANRFGSSGEKAWPTRAPATMWVSGSMAT